MGTLQDRCAARNVAPIYSWKAMLKCTDQVNSLLNDMDRQSVPFAKCKVSLYAGDLKNLDLMYPLKFFVLFFFTTEVLFPPLFPVRTRFIFLFFFCGLFFFLWWCYLGENAISVCSIAI